MPSRMDLYHRSDNEPQTAPSRSRRSRQPLSRERLREEQLPPASKLKKIPPILKPSALLAITLLSVGLMGTFGHKSYSVHSNVVQTDKQRDHSTAIDTSDISGEDSEHSKSSAKKHSKSSSERDSSDDDQTDQDTADQQAQESDTDVSAVGDDDTQQNTTQRQSSDRQTYNQQSPHRHQSSQDNNQSTYQTGGNTQPAQNNQAPATGDNQATYTVPNTGGDNQ